MANDLISRQAAIDAIEEMQMPIMQSIFLEEHYVFRGMSEALRAIKDLPSAEPEIIRCRDCEHHSGSYCHYKYSYGTYVRDNHYCGWAERRIDECLK